MSSTTSTITSFYEQITIIKSGSSCVIGSTKGGLQWGLLGVDFLLMRTLLSSRFSKVICVNNDRHVDDILVIGQNTGKSSKLDLIQGHEHGGITELISEIRSRSASQDKGSLAVFLFSISEMVFQFGLREISRLMKALATDGANGSANAIHCTVGVVHETLHNRSELHYLESLFSNVCLISSNDGTMSSAVLGQIQSIRKSPQTGKFYENVEFFTHANGYLSPIPPMKDAVISSYSNLEAVDNTVGDVTAVLAEVDITKASTSAAQSAAKSSTQITEVFADKRLIAFDSTDPEFDEDSDPDNDLDL